MIKLYIFCLLMFTAPAFSQHISTFPGTPYTNFFDLDIDGSNIAALGDCQQIWNSKDGGAQWSYVELSQRFSSIHFMPGNTDKVVLVASDEMWILTLSTGEFSVITDPITQDHGAIASADRVGDVLYFYNGLGVNALHLNTLTFENTWEWSNPDNDFMVTSTTAGSLLYLGTHKGKVIKYNIATKQASVAIDFGQRIQDIAMADENTGYMVVSGESSLLKTTNQWMNYTQVTGMPEAIRPVAKGNIVVTINTNRMYRSEDGGVTSQYLPYGEEGTLGLVYCSFLTDEGSLYLGGGASTLIKTEDFGRNFTDLNPAIRSDFYDVDILDSGIGYCVGLGSTILKTTDFGMTWTPLDLEIGRPNLSDVVVFSENNFLLLSDGSVFTVQNGQVTDEKMLDAYHMILIPGTQDVLIVSNTGNMSTLRKSSNMGGSWQDIFTTDDQLYRFSLSPDGRIFCTGQDISAYESKDGGNEWTLKTFPYQNLSDVQFFDENTGLIIQGSKLYKTTNGGTTFQTIASRYFIRNLTWLEKDHFFYTSAQNNETNLYESRDGGASDQNVFNVCTQANDITVASQNHLVICHQDGHINRVPFTPLSTGTEESEMNVLSVFPNPVMAGMPLYFGQVYEHIQVFSWLGHTLQAGNNTDQLVIPGHTPPGIYIIRLSDRGQEKVGKVVVY